MEPNTGLPRSGDFQGVFNIEDFAGRIAAHHGGAVEKILISRTFETSILAFFEQLFYFIR